MMQFISLLFLALTASCGTVALAQPTLVGAGYADPTTIRVAPGQITTIFVSGLKTPPKSVQRASGLPLPETLAGLSVRISQTNPKQSLNVPLIAVQPLNACSTASPPPPSGTTPDCFLTAITLQIPYEVQPPPSEGFAFTELTIREAGNDSKAFKLIIVPDNWHILTTCDSFLVPSSGTKGCNPVVVHADGSFVTAESPAQIGETIVIYAVGLGRTNPQVQSGAATPSPAPWLAQPAYTSFDLRLNAGPSSPGHPIILNIAINPRFVGLTPGSVGLYQINILIPPGLETPYPCGGDVRSNLTINVGGSTDSFDGAPICVQATR